MWFRKIVDNARQFLSQGLTKQLKISLAAVIYLMTCYTLLRLGFLISNHEFFTEAGWGEIIKSFIYGLRFDLSALLMINGPLLLVYNLPINYLRRRWCQTAILVLFWFSNLSFIGINLGDYGYFATAQRRLMSEIYMMFLDIMKMLPSMITDFYYLFIALAVGAGVFVWTTWLLFRKLNRTAQDSHNFRSRLVHFIIIAFLLMPGVKGGFQTKPIRPAHAFFSPHRAVGYLTLNSSFTVIKSIFQASVPEYKFMPETEASAEVDRILRNPNEQALDPRYPFLRQIKYAGPPSKKNIVVFIMESWTADFVGCISGKEPSSTPFFDSIAKKGMLFTNFLATGHRTIVAAPSVLASIPGFYSNSGAGKKNSFIESQSEVNNFIGMGSVLARQGYTTSFHHGANTGALGLDIYTKLAGFQRYYGKQDYLNLTDASQDAVWGVWDEEFFLDARKRMDDFKPPFCSVIFSLTSHEPFRVPPHRQALFDKYTGETKFQKVLRYTDYSLEQFFKAAQDKPWFKDTVFIITADHASHSAVNDFYSCFHIPLLIYSPGFINPAKLNSVGSQVDIMPTILNILGISAIHASMGTDLITMNKSHYSVVSDGTRYAIFSDKFVLLNDLEKDIGLYDYRADPMLSDNLQPKYPDEAQYLRRILLAYIQSVSMAISHNRICREKDLK
ncbi:MAG: sulfatase-like hydrolase/transferase [Planctomycetota bacterium]